MGAQMAQEAKERELTLTLETEGARLEEGKAMKLTITAGNPLPYETAVGFALSLPQYVAADGETQWTAVLAPASMDEETGEMCTVTTPALLNGKGIRLDNADASGVYLRHFKPYAEIDFPAWFTSEPPLNVAEEER
jgi:hypothetical protein